MSPRAARRLLILGAGGHGRAVADLARACGFTVAGFTERSSSAGGPGSPVLGTDAELAALIRPQRIDGGVVGVGNTALLRRAQLYDVLVAAGVAQPPLVHPRAAASVSAEVGSGSVVFAGSVLGSGARIGVNAVELYGLRELMVLRDLKRIAAYEQEWNRLHGVTAPAAPSA